MLLFLKLVFVYCNTLMLNPFTGCDILFVPAAYDMGCGSAHWELIHRARSCGNQMFVAAISPARNEKHRYVIYGYSMVIDPNGEIKAKAGINEEILFYEIGAS